MIKDYIIAGLILLVVLVLAIVFNNVSDKLIDFFDKIIFGKVKK